MVNRVKRKHQDAFVHTPYAISRKPNKGFTLIELLVAGGLFAMIIVALSGAFTLVLRAQRQAVADREVVDTTRSAMESMTRAIRTVREEDILNPPLDSSDEENSNITTLSFIHNGKVGGLGCPSAPCEVVYFAKDGVLYELQRPAGSEGGRAFPLTTQAVRVELFRVIITGRGDDNRQPRVTVVLDIRDARPNASQASLLPLTTTVSLRPPELSTE